MKLAAHAQAMSMRKHAPAVAVVLIETYKISEHV